MKIALFGDNQGHRSIALAAQEALSPHFTIAQFHNTKKLIENYYTPLYLLFPPLNQIPYDLGKSEQGQKLLSDFLRSYYQKPIQAFFNEERPDLLLNTHLIYTPILEEISKKTNTPLINIVADPRSIHPALMSKQARVNLVFDERGKQFCLESYPDNVIEPLGWLVRDEFDQPYKIKSVRAALDLDQDTFTLLVASGSEGTTMIMKILPALFTAPKPVQVIVACGSNTTLLRSMKTLANFLKKSKRMGRLIPLGFTDEMYRYMQAADLVIGKAGPNTLFEAVATHTPFFAITHMAGQESGNLDLILEEGLGLVEENPVRATKLLHAIMEDPSQLTSFGPKLETMAAYNRQAKAKLLSHAQEALHSKVSA